jgi:hypothetical protein
MLQTRLAIFLSLVFKMNQIAVFHDRLGAANGLGRELCGKRLPHKSCEGIYRRCHFKLLLAIW